MKLLVHIPFYDRVIKGSGGDKTSFFDSQTFMNNTKIAKTSSYRRNNVMANMKKMLHEIDNYYMFQDIDVIIDTNNKTNIVWDLSQLNRVKLYIKVHHIEKSFLLTWVHRHSMQARQNKYDWFMYVEDDIFVPVKSVEKQLHWASFLYNTTHKLLNFVRVVHDKSGRLFYGDLRRQTSPNEIFEINGSLFGAMTYMYSATWMYPKHIMYDFIHSDYWKKPLLKYDLRASASFGFTNPTNCKPILNAFPPCSVVIYPCTELIVYHTMSSGIWYTSSITTKLPFNNGKGWVK